MAQKAQAWRQPTCDDTQTVDLARAFFAGPLEGGMTTASTSAPSARRTSSLSVPSGALTDSWMAATSAVT